MTEENEEVTSSEEEDDDDVDAWEPDEIEKATKIPFPSIYKWLDAEGRDRFYFIPSLPVTVKILKATRDDTGLHMFSNYIYQIQLQHGIYTWDVYKRFSDFYHLHTSLLLFRASEQVKEPVRKLEKAIADAVDGEPEENVKLSEIKTVETSARAREDIGADQPDAAVKLHAYYNSSASQSGTPVPKSEKRKKRDVPILTLQHDDCYADGLGHSRLIRLPSPNKQQQQLSGSSEALMMGSVPTTQASIPRGSVSTQVTIVPGAQHVGGAEVAVVKSPTKSEKRRKKKFPHLPRTFEATINTEAELEARKLELEEYLQRVLDLYKHRNHPETVEFLEISRLSFVDNLGGKLSEGLLKKRPGGRKKWFGVVRFCIECCARWGKRWVVVKDSFVVYLHPRTEVIRCVMLFDREFDVTEGPARNEGMKHTLVISNKHRELMLKCKSDRKAAEWKRAVVSAKDRSVWVLEHRFNSFAPERVASCAKWYVDGKDHMHDVANMLEMAREEIFIADWWLSPEILMKRPAVEGIKWRLDEILKRKAKEGVKIYILLYKEVAMALGINSDYSKRWLMGLHSNIKVLRHPDHVPLSSSSIMLWAHHEKLVVVDQNVAFVGGIDLCYGRWDDHTHKLTDLGSVAITSSKPKAGYSLSQGMRGMAPIFSGIPVMDALIESDAGEVVVNVRNPPVAEAGELNPIDDSPPIAKSEAGVDQTDRAAASSPTSTTSPPTAGRFKQAAKAFKSLSIASSSAGPSTNRSLSEVVGQMGSKQRATSDATGLVVSRPVSMPGDGPTDVGNKIDLAEVVRLYKEFIANERLKEADLDNVDSANETSPRHGPGKIKRYINAWKKRGFHRKNRAEKAEEDELAREYEKILQAIKQQEDYSDLKGKGKLWMGKDYVNFIFKDFDRVDIPFSDFIERTETPRMPWHDIASVVYGAAARDVARHFIQRWNAAKVEKLKDNNDYPLLLPKSYEHTTVPKFFRKSAHTCSVQILRSSCLWSVGENHVESSIQEAYIHMISEAQHYIYIENQFFISMINSTEVLNGISKALCDRIVKAYQNNEQFRVFILLPLLPGFEGEIGAGTGGALQAVLYWTYRSINSGPYSLLANLEAKIGDVSRYINFCGLRTHDELSGELITELVYIHSKLIIVDDCQCLIGSANINDRSQLGTRDSEVAIYVKDEEFDESLMDGKPFRRGKFCGSLRMQLFREHLGLLPRDESEELTPYRHNNWPQLDVRDIISDQFWAEWEKISQNNTDIYEKVFRCIPTDKATTQAELKVYQSEERTAALKVVNREYAEQLLREVQGHLVCFARKFLSNTNLSPSIMTKEGLAPISLWT